MANRILSITLDSEADEKLRQFVAEINAEQQKVEDEHLKILTTALKDFAYGDIVKIVKAGDTTMAVPILCTCFIEQMATYRYSRDVGSKEFLEFVKSYLPAYHAESLRLDLRNKLVHNYAVGDTYTIIKGYPEFHLKKSKGDQKTILNVESFVDDLGKVLDRFILEIEQDKGIRKTVLIAMEKFPVVHFIDGESYPR